MEPIMYVPWIDGSDIFTPSAEDPRCARMTG
jgi:hypothetical protein